jgi:hypothetical protein
VTLREQIRSNRLHSNIVIFIRRAAPRGGRPHRSDLDLSLGIVALAEPIYAIFASSNRGA